MANKFMKIAIKEAFRGMRKNEGGPFGAVIVKEGKVIAKGHNLVLKAHDPSSHAEITAIRKASKKLKRHHLSDCEIYTSCMPCPMCLGAIYWARIKRVFYGCKEEDAEKLGFNDKIINEAMKENKGKLIEFKELDRTECLKPFEEFIKKYDKEKY